MKSFLQGLQNRIMTVGVLTAQLRFQRKRFAYFKSKNKTIGENIIRASTNQTKKYIELRVAVLAIRASSVSLVLCCSINAFSVLWSIYPWRLLPAYDRITLPCSGYCL